MNKPTTKADLHVHSKYSKRPAEWILQKIGCPESFTEPRRIYEIARARGMSFVTITDHNTIDGCLEIADLPGTFISEEVTSYLPHDGCKIHVLVFNISEAIHREIQRLRENVFDLAHYLRSKEIVHALAHPLYAVNGLLSSGNFEQLLVLFKNFELNGSRDHRQNQMLKAFLSNLAYEHLVEMAQKYHLSQFVGGSWPKNVTGGSDDHSALHIARTHSVVENCAGIEAFVRGIQGGCGLVIGQASTPEVMAQNLYSIAYQFYRNKLCLERSISKDPFLSFLERLLNPSEVKENSIVSKLYFLWNQRKNGREKTTAENSVLEILRDETRRLIGDDPEFMKILEEKTLNLENPEEKWFRFVNGTSNKVLSHFADYVIHHLTNANIVSVMHSLGSAGTLYFLLAPYFVSYSLFSGGYAAARNILELTRGEEMPHAPEMPKVAHFTDTYYDCNGVALTLRQQVALAREGNYDLTVISCDQHGNHANGAGVKHFEPIGIYELPEYPGIRLCFPPLLEMLKYCYDQNVTVIHSATPGPVGLGALMIARILKLPLHGTYHTAFPQYARYFTGDADMEEIMWKYMLWYYKQMDTVFAPSQHTALELIGKGITAEKIRIMPRGVDTQRFHPSKRNGYLKDRYPVGEGMKLLYVGRISKEKNLHLLGEAFKELVRHYDDLTLIVVGEGPYLGEMKENMKGDRCVFTGYLDGEDLAAVYASCDLFVFPSTTDTFGNVVMEAQASGLAVIVTDEGGAQENIVPGETGLVVKGNEYEGLRQGIETLISKPSRIQEMGRKARQYVEERTFADAFHRTWSMYVDDGVREEVVCRSDGTTDMGQAFCSGVLGANLG